MSNNTGGPAFPQNTKIVAAAGQELHQGFIGGMTLRDYFAAKAMQGLISSRHTDYENGWYDEEQLAGSAYKMADAMLKARQV
jgi:hypothetical protein